MQHIISFVSNPLDLILDQTNMYGKLYLGGIDSLQSLDKHNIKTVISLCTVEKLSDKYNHFRFKVRDHPDDVNKMIRLTPQLINLIHHYRGMGNVLVHCRGGIQRSATIVAKYIQIIYKYDIGEAISLIRKKRPIAFINGYTFPILLNG